MNNRIHILDKNIPQSDNILYIDSSTEGYPFLAYQNDGSVISIIEGNSYDRPIHCSELINMLLSMSPGIKFIASSYNPNLYFIFPTDNISYQEIPTSLISKINPSLNIRNEIDGFTETGVSQITENSLKSIKICTNYDDSTLNSLNNKLDDLLEEYIPNREDNFSYEKELRNTTGPYSIDVMTNSTVINLISKTTYTDTVDFNKLAKRVSEVGISGKADISIQYTKKEKIYSQATCMKAFEYLATGDLYIPDYISKLGEIQLEYFNGILRVIPIPEDIDECIINNCTVTYGNLEMKKL